MTIVSANVVCFGVGGVEDERQRIGEEKREGQSVLNAANTQTVARYGGDGRNARGGGEERGEIEPQTDWVTED